MSAKPEQPTTKHRICVISGDKFRDKFLHAADVFESTKMLAEPEVFEVEVNANTDWPAIIIKFKEAAKAANRVVAAVFVVGAEIGWVDSSVLAISNGHTFSLLSDVLRSYGFKGYNNAR